MNSLFESIDRKAFSDEIIAFRRDLHVYPESGWTEFRTTAKILEKLGGMGLKVSYGKEIHLEKEMFGKPSEEYFAECEKRAIAEGAPEAIVKKMHGGYTGCVAVLEGKGDGPTVAFRVDIDCNEVNEAKDPKHFPFKEGFASSHDGLMHACGHDGHAAIGVGALKLLCANRDRINGKIIFVFQPAEEGLRGARSIAYSGILDTTDYIFGAHLGLGKWPVGEIAVAVHGFLASTKFDVTFDGKAAHAGASPQEGNNALAAAATATLNMLAIPRHSAGSSRINIGTLHAGTGRNVIPEKAEMVIETRGLTSEINEFMEESAKRVCKAAADMYCCEYHECFMGSAGSAGCDLQCAEIAKSAASKIGDITAVHDDMDMGGGEDYTYMMKRVQQHGGKATFMVSGASITAPHHNGYFSFDENVIPTTAMLLAQIALDICK